MHPDDKTVVTAACLSFAVDGCALVFFAFPRTLNLLLKLLLLVPVLCRFFLLPSPLLCARHMIPAHDRRLVASPRPTRPSTSSTSNAAPAGQRHTEFREHPLAPGSRTRILEAVRYCCGWQNLQTVCGQNGAYLTVSELQYHTDNDILLRMKLNLNTVTFSIFCKRVWGREQAFSMQLVDHSTECQ